MKNAQCINSAFSTTRIVSTVRPDLANLSDGQKTKNPIIAEGGLRTKNFYKQSYESRNNSLYIAGSKKKIEKELISDGFRLFPVVTIITVVFNGKAFIEDAILSILNQSYSNIEYILIDGGSTDNTIDILKKYNEQIDYWISQKDDGLYDAMNKGIGYASGDIIGILNADDILYDNYIIEKIVTAFNDSEALIVYGNLFYVDPSNTNTIKRNWKSSPFKPGSFSKGWHPPHPSMYVKRSVYDQCGLFDASLSISSDFELMLRFFEKCRINSFYLNETFVKMRMGGASNNSLASIMRGNKNILFAFKKNGIKVNSFMYLLYRFIPKVMQLLKAKLRIYK